jgi:hypothetical protein
MSLLAINSDAKTCKGVARGYLTGILYLAPAETSGAQMCAHSSLGCRLGCLNTSGRGVFKATQRARIKKTRWLLRDRAGFVAQLRKDIQALERKAKREGLVPCVRLNGTSDLPWLAHQMADEFKHIQFYDYTKHPAPWSRERWNYHLTFSLSEINEQDAWSALLRGVSVAVVFKVKKGKQLPRVYMGHPVIDGDRDDLRFLDDRAVIVGLRAKGRAKRDCTGFVRELPLVQIGGIAA